MSNVQHIPAATAKQWLDNGEAVLVDVREPAEHAAQHIPGAALLPLGQVCCGKLPETSGKKLIIHCKAGKRGSLACEKLLSETPELNLYNLEGGMDAWINAGYDIADTGTTFLPLDQQVQLTVGALIVLSVLLGYTVHPAFLILTGFFGCGLMFAGLTGFCGMARLLAKMPWNQTTSTSYPTGGNHE